MQVFRTKKDFPEQIQILGVGVMRPYGEGAVSVEAAARAMTELSKKDEDGKLVRDEQGGLIPLTGKELTAAAKEWAERHDGVELATIKEAEMDKLRASGELRVDHTAEDTQAAAEWYASKANPVITKVDPFAGVVSAEHATAAEAAEAVGEDLTVDVADEEVKG